MFWIIMVFVHFAIFADLLQDPETLESKMKTYADLQSLILQPLIINPNLCASPKHKNPLFAKE